jgi:multidrug efflux system outer membrane protein
MKSRLLLPVLATFANLAVPAAATARAYKLDELIEMARKTNPGLAAGAQATAGIEAQLSEANRSWMPTGDVTSLVAPVPEIRCGEDSTQPKAYREDHCSQTSNPEASINFRGVFTRTELHLVQPLFTFGKIDAGKVAAQQGVIASKNREEGMIADLDLNVKKAYWGLKLARAVYDTLTEGTSYLEDAQKQVDKELAAGTGSVTQTDKLRLKTVRAELDVRLLEARRMGDFARNGLRALLGPDAPADLDIDAEPLEPLEVPKRPLGHYEEQARLSRPEVRALDHFVASKRALADLERRKQYPDLILVGTAAYAYASSIDNPQSAFANDPFNTAYVGAAIALRFPIDFGVRNAHAVRVQAEAEESAFRRREALGGIAFEVQRAYGELTEATDRLQAVRLGERAGKAWITAVAQNFATGLAEAKDFSDALAASFQFRVRVLQAVFDLNVAAASLARATGAEVAHN